MLRETIKRYKKGIIRRLNARKPPPSYHDTHADTAAEYYPIKEKKVLVVGCNTGEDCKLFIKRGACEVHGVDVIDDIGKNFKHGRVRYHRVGIENTGLPTGHFDIVYSVATMEHVPDIKSGFAEMVRLAKPGGLIYAVASPLWQSRYGHHMGCFEAYPWIHLVYARDELVAYARSQGIDGERGHTIEDIVDYMLNPAFFNMKPGNEFIEACAVLTGVRDAMNELVLEPEELLAHPLGQRALAMGFTPDNLRAVIHKFIAFKAG